MLDDVPKLASSMGWESHETRHAINNLISLHKRASSSWPAAGSENVTLGVNPTL